MDESCTLMLNVRTGKTSVERKPNVGGGEGWRRRKSGTVLWERQAERMQGRHAGSVLLEGSQRRQQSSGTLQTNSREEEVEEDKRREVKD